MLVVSAAFIVGSLSGSAVAQDRARRIGRVKSGTPSDRAIEERYRIILPPGFSKDFKLTPVVFALHGFGGSMRGMELTYRDACAEIGAILVVCEGAIARTEGGHAWSGAEDAGEVIAAARREVQKRYRLSASAPRVLTGMSQGGFATWALALRYPKTYRRLIPVVGMYKPTSAQLVEPLTDEQKAAIRRWRVYDMVGVLDKQELVSNNTWVVNELREAGAAVKAPFMEPRDPSFEMYQSIGHGYPGEGPTRQTELLRALKFVLQPDETDIRNWSKVDPDWRDRARWTGGS